MNIYNKMCQDPTFNLVDAVCGRYGWNLQLAGSYFLIFLIFLIFFLFSCLIFLIYIFLGSYSHGRRQVKIAGDFVDSDDVGDDDTMRRIG